jgi:ABC-type sugar transport system substrate-binding protein
MTRRPCKFRQREIARAIRAARSAGVAADIEIDPNTGRIVVHIGTGGDNPTKHKNTADAVLEKLKNERKT